MRETLRSRTDAGSHVLFDPVALAVGDPQAVDPAAELQSSARAGRCWHYCPGGDGGVTLAVLVDERREDVLRESSEEVPFAGGYLHVPSGRLVFAGVEDAVPGNWAPGQEPGELRHGEECVMPPGHYRVDAWELEWGREGVDELWAEAEEDGGSRCRSVVAFQGGCLAPWTLIGLPALVLAQGLLGGWVAGLRMVLVAGLVTWFTWFLVGRYLGRSETWRRLHELQREQEERQPDLVVELTRLDAVPESWRPGWFGVGCWKDDDD